jgi:isoleucyl-tRNA synthetase
MNEPDYNHTIFLPKTDFSMRGDLPQKEPEIVKFWEDIDLFQQLRDQSKDKKKWTLHWGPPYANGHIHIGHALSETLKDQIVKFHQMRGYNASLVPGWDCHGLPIEWKIEEQYREKGLDRDEADPIEFRQECRDFASQWVDIQSGSFKRLGIVGDWDDPYLTMRNTSEGQIVREIHKFLMNESLYQGAKPVMWSVVEKTALAEAEIEYKEHKSVSVWVKFPVKETPFKMLKGASIAIWTTTPWTLPSNRAIAFHDDIEYGVFKTAEGEKIAVAMSLAEDVKQVSGIESWDLEIAFKGSDLKDTICIHPLHGKGYDFDVPMLPADFVTADTGTGFVHIAPSHGEDDFELGKLHKLEMVSNITDDGHFADHVLLFGGDEAFDKDGQLSSGNFTVIREMKDAGALMAKKTIRHDYPHSWRSKAPLIFRTTPQWFIAMDDDNKLREKALQSIKDVNWVPSTGENRINAMIETRPDWCVSRQRLWGVPLAFFMNKKTNEPLRDEAVLKRISDMFDEHGSDAWWSMDSSVFLGDEYNANDYEKVFDIIDVWFESGSTHSFVLEQRDDVKWPADLYLEGSDQHRGWFHSSLLEGCGTRGRAPYDNVMTHGFVLDENGRKMSKSEGNVVDPQEVMDEFGADVIRLWAITSDYAHDVTIGDGILKATSNHYRKVRNTLRFLMGALDGFTLEEQVNESDYSKMPELEQLMLHRLKQLDDKIEENIEAYNYRDIMNDLYDFCLNDLSSFYFTIRKDRLYCDDPDMFERKACRTVMGHILERLTKWYAPVLSFTCEDVWQNYPACLKTDEQSIHMTQVTALPEAWLNPELASKWVEIEQVREVVLAAIEPHRQNKEVGSSLEVHPIIYIDEKLENILVGQDMAELCVTSQATVTTDTPPTSAFTLKHVDGVAVVFQKAAGNKCARSWKILPDVGQDNDHPSLSARDVAVVRKNSII